jgi:primosomal protein N' (replication factor Y)
MNKMHIDVLFPINAGSFTYSVPEELVPQIKTGSRVLTPFKRAEKVGIITRIYKKGKSDLSREITVKEVKDVLDDEPFLPRNILKIIEWTGQYYLSTPGLALKNAVPSAFFTGGRPGKTRITYDKEIKEQMVFELMPQQQEALARINQVNEGVFLLHGVTGSGKTEVYMRAIKALPDDRNAIVLVPEISITAQMIDRFRSSFGEQVVFFHSGISRGEKIRQWWKMRRGEARVVIGVRSAVFAPYEKLGLIVVDEEQEASYKQSDGLRYNARDVALVRAKLEGFKIVLGSATPSLESYHNAMEGKFHYLELPKRVGSRPMPDVEILDLTKEKKWTAAFSEKLLNVLKDNFLQGKQALIMLNRRGYAPFLMCTDCGYSAKCPACSITLTYHKDTKTLKCHYCGSFLYPYKKCPECEGTKIRYAGLGTQKVEEELQVLVPSINLSRMDSDTTQKKLSHYRIIKEMENGATDILLGTQMVAKGHDLPNVTVSAVISSDMALNLPDFRSAERAFQLFVQLAGRAGRGDYPGKVYIQTYNPGHYVFEYVKNNDYKGFFQKEMSLREELSYPPFSKMVRIVLKFRTRDIGKKIIKEVSEIINNTSSKGIDILGPSPAPIEKIRNLWRWHLIISLVWNYSIKQDTGTGAKHR